MTETTTVLYQFEDLVDEKDVYCIAKDSFDVNLHVSAYNLDSTNKCIAHCPPGFMAVVDIPEEEQDGRA